MNETIIWKSCDEHDSNASSPNLESLTIWCMSKYSTDISITLHHMHSVGETYLETSACLCSMNQVSTVTGQEPKTMLRHVKILHRSGWDWGAGGCFPSSRRFHLCPFDCYLVYWQVKPIQFYCMSGQKADNGFFFIFPDYHIDGKKYTYWYYTDIYEFVQFGADPNTNLVIWRVVSYE